MNTFTSIKNTPSIKLSLTFLLFFFFLFNLINNSQANNNLDIKSKNDWSAPLKWTYWQTYYKNKSNTDNKEFTPEEKTAQKERTEEKKKITKKLNQTLKKYKNKSIKTVRIYLKSLHAFDYLNDSELSEYLQNLYPNEKLTPTKTKKIDENGNKLWWPFVYSPKIYKIVIHHTGDEIPDPDLLTSTDYQKINWATKVQNIFKYHAYTKKWGDIGYHYLIDPLGNIYAGRGDGDETVVGGHAYLSNIGTVGIAIIGNYENNKLTSATKDSLIKLIAKIAKKHNLDLNKKSTFHGISSYNIIGHRDLGATICPGKKIYTQLTNIRKEANKLLSNTHTKRTNKKSSTITKYHPYTPRQNKKYLTETDFQFKFLTNYVNINNNPTARQKIKIGIKNRSILNIDQKDLYLSIESNSTYLKDLSTKVYLRKDLPRLGESDFNLYANTNQKLGTTGFYIQAYYQKKKIGEKHFVTVKINKSNDSTKITSPSSSHKIITPQTVIQMKKQNSQTSIPVPTSNNSPPVITNHPNNSLEKTETTPAPIINKTNSDGIAIDKISLNKNVRVKISQFKETSVKIKLHGQYQVINSHGKTIFRADNHLLNFQLNNNELTFTCPDKSNLCLENNLDSKHFKLKAINRVFAYVEITNYNNKPAWNTRLNDNLFREDLYIVNNGNQIEIVNELSLMNYLKGVAEINNSDPSEKLKTMALLVKNYTLYYLSPSKQKFPDKFYNLDDSPERCQKYLGYGFEKRANNWISALEKTFSEVIIYNNKLIKTPYFSQSDGKTKSANEVWGRQNTPYLKSVNDKYCSENKQLGHGVGLSWCGALGMAQAGMDYKEIVQYFYQGVDIIKLP